MLFRSLYNIVVRGIGRRFRDGVANSIVATMRNLGQSSSMAVLTIVIGMHLGNIPLENAGTSELLATIKTSFLIFVVLCIAGMLMSLKSGSEKIKD